MLELTGVRRSKPAFRPVTVETVRLPLIVLPWLDDRPRDACGRKRSQATLSTFRKGKKPANAGKTYPPTPPDPEQVLAILQQGSPTAPADIRNRAVFGLVWRSGLRISEALALDLNDLSREHNSVLVRCGKGGKRRISGIDDFGFELLDPWLEIRPRYPVGPLFCVVEGKTKGNRVNRSTVAAKLHEWAQDAGVERRVGDEVIGRVAPHQLRHAHACDLAREGVPVQHVSRQLGHANLAITTTYLQGIAPVETLSVIAARPRPELKGGPA
jgi:site-specific recombinase XerD